MTVGQGQDAVDPAVVEAGAEALHRSTTADGGSIRAVMVVKQ